ncbi:MAG: putative LPS assembly protein LptD, partial [Candidatus Thiodiazotropha sp.]
MSSRSLPIILSLCLLTTRIAAAEDRLRIDRGINWDYCEYPPSETVLPATLALPGAEVQIEADQIEFDQEKELSLLRGSVQLWRLDGYAEADSISFDHQRRIANLFGNLFIEQGGLRATGEEGYLELDDDRGWLSETEFRLTTGGARGSAALITLNGRAHSSYRDVAYSTCPPDRDDWSLVASELDIDMAQGWGSARHARLELAGVPILYLPYFTFPVDERRKTGLLIPTMGSSNRLGSELTLPYYFNLAPNYDATLTPRLMSKRGVMLGAEFRFLGARQRGEISGEILSADRQQSPDRDDRRSVLRFYHVCLPYPGLATRIETSA